MVFINVVKNVAPLLALKAHYIEQFQNNSDPIVIKRSDVGKKVKYNIEAEDDIELAIVRVFIHTDEKNGKEYLFQVGSKDNIKKDSKMYSIIYTPKSYNLFDVVSDAMYPFNTFDSSHWLDFQTLTPDQRQMMEIVSHYKMVLPPIILQNEPIIRLIIKSNGVELPENICIFCKNPIAGEDANYRRIVVNGV